MRTVVTYDRLTVTGHKTLPCPECGKRVRRQRTFGQTVSPYNRNSDGTVKTAAEVRASVVASVREWERVVEPCASHKVVVG